MNRINQLFIDKKQGILNIYFTAGYPHLESTVPIILALAESKVDLIEIGMPYSDPLADGPTIQASSQVALKNGMSLDLLFDQLAIARSFVETPFVLMGYFNQVLQYGVSRFISKSKDSGVDGLILPDLPVEEYILHYRKIFEEQDMKITFLISPQTPESRILAIDSVSNSFIYMVSSSSITGAKSEIDEHQVVYFDRIHKMNLNNPRLIGFGISSKSTYDSACKYAQGAIIGSAFIKSLSDGNNMEERIKGFVQMIR